jgi:hypothetical protein
MKRTNEFPEGAKETDLQLLSEKLVELVHVRHIESLYRVGTNVFAATLHVSFK